MTAKAPLRVAIDGRALVGERTGIGVHTAEIAGRLDLATAPLIASHVRIADRQAIDHCRFIAGRWSPTGVIWQQFIFPRIARNDEADVVWGPHGTLPLALRLPSVVTIHDLTSMTMPRRHRIRTILSFNVFIARSLDKASAISVVSRATGNEVMRRFGIPAEKLTLVYNGVDEIFAPAGATSELDRFGISPHDYLLFAGTLEPRKGVSDLISAWEALGEPRPKLVLAGGRGWGLAHLERRIAPYVRERAMVLTGYVERETLRQLYSNAAVFVYPSYHEGFGLPPLEAMACGAPVVTSRSGALPEIVGDAALLVRAGRPSELRDAIARVLGDAVLAGELRARGLERARRFRWEESARVMRELLEAAARKGI
ncbi:MAG TPA: glycosyltransferase family 1 protein [Thermoanaerobaculia bacterium]|nr:glycosyltransferase family 1 protein [Thermoanaerobaculia bacterium]